MDAEGVGVEVDDVAAAGVEEEALVLREGHQRVARRGLHVGALQHLLCGRMDGRVDD